MLHIYIIIAYIMSLVHDAFVTSTKGIFIRKFLKIPKNIEEVLLCYNDMIYIMLQQYYLLIKLTVSK